MSIKQKIAQDQILSAIQAKFEAQTSKGVEKYGQTVAGNDLTAVEWIDHAIEEAIDHIVYLECLKARLLQHES